MKNLNIFKQIKQHCNNLPRLPLPLENDDLILETDASEKFWSGILKKIDYEDNKKKGETPCRCCSGTFSNTQARYHINEKNY